MKKKGFTLIELLATIVVLAVILAIAVPSISNILDNAKKNTFISNANLVIDTINYKLMEDKNYDLSSLSVDTIETDLNLSNDNYDSISAYLDTNNDINIYIDGKNKWDGLVAYGKRNDITLEAESMFMSYYASDIDFDYQTATNELSIVDNEYDESYGVLNTGFDITFGDNQYSTLYVGINGVITFSSDSYMECEGKRMGSRLSDPTIAIYWDDLIIDKSSVTDSGIYYSTGTEDGKQYVLIEYRDIFNFNTNRTADYTGNFEIKIYEDGIMKLYYKDTNFGSNGDYDYGITASIGATASTTSYVNYSYHTASLTDNMGIKFDLKLTPRVVSNNSQPTIAADSCFTFNTEYAAIMRYDVTNEACPLNLIIPSTIGGQSVQAIAYQAFMGNIITGVTIPSSVTIIGDQAFANTSLTSVTLAEGLTTISAEAFMNTSITSLTIPSSVTSIGDKAFMNGKLTSLTLPNTNITLGNEAFNNNQLTDDKAFIYARNTDGSVDNTKIVGYGGAKRSNVVIPSSVVTVGEYAFKDNQLTSVTIPSSVTAIEDYAFNNNLLTSITIPSTVTLVDSYAFGNNQLTSLTIPSGITTIFGSAFEHNQLASLTIPSNITSIETSAFYDNQLTSVTIPSSVTYISLAAFNNNQLPDDQAFIYERQSGGVINTEYIVSYGGAKRSNISIPDGVKYIGGWAFCNQNISSITLPDTVTSISTYAFSNNQISTISLPNSIVNMYEAAFVGNQLTSITIPSGLTTIPANAFSTNKITSVTIPSNITTVQNYAFVNNQLTSIILPDTVTTWGDGIFVGNQLTNITLPSNMTTIPNSMFADNKLTSYTVPSTVTTIKAGAFRYNKIASLTIPESVTTIEDYAFLENPFTSITIQGTSPQRFNSTWTNIGFPSSLMPS